MICRWHRRTCIWTTTVVWDSCLDSCLEVAVLKGTTRDVRDFARRVIAERGVRHGRLVTVPVEFENQKHAHGVEPSRQHLHVHVREAR